MSFWTECPNHPLTALWLRQCNDLRADEVDPFQTEVNWNVHSKSPPHVLLDMHIANQEHSLNPVKTCNMHILSVRSSDSTASSANSVLLHCIAWYWHLLFVGIDSLLKPCEKQRGSTILQKSIRRSYLKRVEGENR